MSAKHLFVFNFDDALGEINEEDIMSSDHNLFKYSITCKTDDIAVLHCLRALCQFAEKHRKPQIGWGGTGESDWRSKKGQFTLRFTSPIYREFFVKEAHRILNGYWSVVDTNDNDPAYPQR